MDISQIIKKIKNSLSTPKGLFVAFFLALMIFRLVYILLPAKIAWDASVYIGMAEYLTSFGRIGLWEYFRPPVLPIMFSVGKLFNIPIVAWAQFLTFLASAVSLYLIFKIGEKIRPFAGVFAAVALGVSTLFMSMSSVPMTEVFGVFFGLAALYFLFIKESYFLAGLLAGLCFLARFPYGLLIVIFGLSLLFFNWKDKHLWKIFLKRSFYLCLGFFLISVSYLVSNYYLYGDPFLPLATGVQVIAGTTWIYQRAPGFYENVLFLQNPLFIFSILTIFLSFFRGFFSDKKYIIFSLLVWFIIFFAYFVSEVHKEARYIITVFPSLALLSGISLSYLYEKHKRYLFYSAMVLLIAVTFYNTNFFIQPESVARPFDDFYSLLDEEYGKTVIASSPMLVAYSPVKIVPAYDRWENFKNTYENSRFKADFISIDSCELHVCTPGEENLCENNKKEVLNKVLAEEKVIYDKTVGICRHIIAEIKK